MVTPARSNLKRITTGSGAFDSLLGGGLPLSSITDVYGASGTGKTQFAFQNAITTAVSLRDETAKPVVAFVDCAGSFRPERILEIAEHRLERAEKLLESVSTIYVRNAEDQASASRRLDTDNWLSDCRLVIVDDATVNFVADFGRDFVERQTALSLYLCDLAHIALKRNLSVLITNSARFREESGEAETTGDLLSEFSLNRMHFTRVDRRRYATLMQPVLGKPKIEFEINSSGIT
jgi:DNA repair protein RadA